MGNITIKQIAEMAGVSAPAVSYVLNGKKGVSEETRQKILRIINDLEYTPNLNSRRLIMKRSFNILVSLDTSVSTLENMFYTEVLHAITIQANKLGYNIVLSMENVISSKENLISALSQKNADGIIFLRDIPSSVQETIQSFGVPFVVIDSHKAIPPYPCIKSNTELMSYTATKYLISKGHTKIAYIGMNRFPDYYLNSFSGYQRALSEFHLSIHPDWIQAEAFDEPSARKCMENILKCGDIPTALFCNGDIFAIGAMNYLLDHGYKIPEDFSLIGSDDILLAQYYNPSLSTLYIDKHRMGSLAVEMLDHLILGESTEPYIELPSDQIIERHTVRELGAT